jgi:hypothetical protein
MGTLDENGHPVWYWLLGAAAVMALIGLLLLDETPRSAERLGSECEVSGRVTNEEGKPVTAYELTVRAPSGKVPSRRITVTDPEGDFGLSLPAGSFVLSCVAEGYPLHEERFMASGERCWLPITLRR